MDRASAALVAPNACDGPLFVAGRTDPRRIERGLVEAYRAIVETDPRPPGEEQRGRLAHAPARAVRAHVAGHGGQCRVEKSARRTILPDARAARQ